MKIGKTLEQRYRILYDFIKTTLITSGRSYDVYFNEFKYKIELFIKDPKKYKYPGICPACEFYNGCVRSKVPKIGCTECKQDILKKYKIL